MLNRFSLVLLLTFSFAGPASAAGTAEQAVTFSFSAPHAASVALAGSFNQWDFSRHLLTGPDRSGNWTVTLSLSPGRYEYLFVINGSRWEPDPAASTADDGMGGRNSVIMIEPK